ncbi:AAA family ATPase [Flavobacterium galactosidilyticum]|uniref:AAA family ATPase n=1 Tax=Flavobacterium galactosidilyticum TaxID=2893886 RepID=UPI001E4FAE90|nr:AAA family ATPase [Flavobacterium sp. F-340]UFH45305.1 AAA family ATPase [Flavobacterium sp. F-340]
MHLSELKLWNFRKYGSEIFELDNPDLIVPFNRGLNVLIGENDSGKTAIIDAIKLVLKTHAYEWIKVDDFDFYKDSEKLRIELEFKGLVQIPVILTTQFQFKVTTQFQFKVST